MAVVIRRAEVADASVLARVGAALFAQAYDGSIPPGEMALHLAEDFGDGQQLGELSDPDVVSWLVEEDGEPLGFAQIRARPLPVPTHQPADVELWRIYLDRRLHGRGVGRELLSRIGGAAREMRASGVWLAVWEENARAIAFYSKHGFTPVGRQEFRVGHEVHTDLVLRASLDAW